MTDVREASIALLGVLARAVTARALYPVDHPGTASLVTELVDSLTACLAARGDDELSMLVIDDDVVLDDRPLRTKSLSLRPLVRVMARHGIQRLTLSLGFDEDEARELITELATGFRVEGTPHARVGRVALGDGEEGEDAARRPPISEGALDEGQESFSALRSNGGQGSIERLDRLVWQLMEGLAGASRSLLLLGPVGSFDEHLYLHSVSVATLALAQARSLGIEGEALHAIGLGALLHDIGKLQLPAELLARQGRLQGRDWEIFQLHPELGAAQLAGADGVPPIAVLVAYEHHLRWDAKPSYPRPREPRVPSLASQLTAVADTWDTLVGGYGAGGPIPRQLALEVWRERSGTYLDPFLVGHFLLMVSEAGVEA